MGDSRQSRVENTLHTLLESLTLPQSLREDEQTCERSFELALERGKRIVEDGATVNSSEINQSHDLIRRKLLRDNASPERAARFGNLYSRLLSTPVLNQKWSILYLLHRLAEATPADLRQTPFFDSVRSSIILQDSQVEGRRDSSSRKIREHSTPEKELEVLSSDGQGAQGNPSRTRFDDQHTAAPSVGDPKDSSEENMLPEACSITPSEATLLRDLPFNLQGLSSTHLHFVNSATIELPPTLPIPVLSLLHSIAEPCLLYRQLSAFTQESGGGLIEQSLRAAITIELRSYLSLVATLEGEIRTELTVMEHEDAALGARKVGVTLKKCVIWTREATMSLRLMAFIVEESRQRKGGQLISLIYGFSSSHGDSFVEAFADRLLGRVTGPFYDMLRGWIYEGELIDPYDEFFVSEPDPATRSDVDPRRVQTSVWEDKYFLNDVMTPSIISADFARKTFLIGKSLHFLRHNCGDSDWVIHHSKAATKELRYGDTATLEASIDDAYKTTMTRLTHLMSTKYHLFTHLQAIKKYLLLSQGDFIALLMESLAPLLDRPAYSQYRHTLTSQLEHAIRHSNAQYDDAEVLRRLDARMVELGSGEIGWDSFTLEYKISAPCNVVITQWAGMQYLKVFNLLWRIKRVEFSLSTTWRRCMTGSRGVLCSLEGNLSFDWKKTRCVIAEMVHFVNQLQYYILFEVIEASWDQLQTVVNKPRSTLDDLIEAHKIYINSITRKGLLGNSRHGSTGKREDSFLSQLHYILKNMLAYKDTVNGLYSHSVAEFSRSQELSAKIEQRTAQGKWGLTERDLLPSESSHGSTSTHTTKTGSAAALISDASSLIRMGSKLGAGNDSDLLVSLRARLSELSAEFKSRINMLLYDLAHQPDVDMRFLGVVMNFNEVYKPVNSRRQAATARERREKRENQTAETNGRGGGWDTIRGDEDTSRPSTALG